MDRFGKKWKGLELRRGTNLIKSNRMCFCAVATLNREKPKEDY